MQPHRPSENPSIQGVDKCRSSSGGNLGVKTVRGNRAELPDEKVSNSPDTPAPPPVTRITVALIAKAASDLRRTLRRTHMSQTDVVNRALSLYEFVDSELSSGAEVIIRKEGQEHHVVLL
jgi:hypothetical protein